ncbi:ComF family protein [Candidatus Latescibacterota bacterium]
MNISAFITEASHAVLDFLFPPECPVCDGAFDSREIICTDCLAELSECSARYHPDKSNPEYVDDISILLPYNSVCRKMIHALKYHGMHSTGIVLGKLMARKTLANFTLDNSPSLVPVPLHPAKMNERGYNQSERIAEGFSAFSGFEIRGDLLTRNKETNTQTALGHTDRALNVSGAFSFSGGTSLAGKQILLIDDVLTTGATVSECAKALKEGGAGNITVCVAATPDIGND